MALDSESFNKDLYDLLKVRGYKPVPLNSQNQRVDASQTADVLQFTFTKDGKDYGKAWISIDDAQNVIVYYDDEQQNSPGTNTPGIEYDDTWTGFLKHLKNWAQRRQLSFELSNKDRLGDDMKQRDYYKMKEKMTENKNVSEVSDKTLKSYVKKAKPEYNQAWLDMDTKKMKKRGQGVDKAEAKMAKEEQINEIGDTPAGKKALGSYVKKATMDKGIHSFANGKDYERLASGGKNPWKDDQYNKDFKTRQNRGTGVNRAVDRLTKEEQINEIGDTPKGQKALAKVSQRNAVGSYDATYAKGKYEQGNTAAQLADKKAKHQNVRAQAEKRLKPETSRFGLDEGYHPMGKKASYNDAVPDVKIILQHNRALEEGEQRYRNVARIYLENVDGERFLAPTNRPGIARVYARHIAEGGLPNDERWNHIKGLCEEYSQMAGFVRATRSKQFNESAQQLVNEGINHYNSLRETLGRMTGHRGYSAYFESWTPTLMENDGDDSSINELFVQETMDPRIESVMPILSRLHKKVNEMSEVTALDSWADDIMNEHLEEDSDGPYDKHEHSDYARSQEPAMEEGLGDKIKSVAKKVKRGLAGWNDGNSVAGVKADTDTLDAAGLNWSANERTVKSGSPADLQKKLAARKINQQAKRGTPNDIKKNLPWVAENELEEANSPEQARKKFHQHNDTELEYMIKASKGKMKPGDAHKQKRAGQAKDAAYRVMWKDKNTDEGLEEDLDANQKRVGQLGPTEKVKNNNIGKLVGASESVETDELARIAEMAGIKKTQN